MRFRIPYRISLSLFCVFAVGFLLNTEAFSHEYKGYTHTEFDISAEDITDIANEAKVRELVLHIVKHENLIHEDTNLDAAGKNRESVILLRRMRETKEDGGDGVFNHGDVYPIGIISSRKSIVSHGRYPELYGRIYASSEDPLKTLLAENLPLFPDSTNPECVNYNHGGMSRVACAIRQRSSGYVVTTVVGFHHAENDPVVLAPNCPDFTLDTTAKQVEDETDIEEKRSLLKKYVGGVIDNMLKALADKAREVAADGFDINTEEGQREITGRIVDLIPCFTTEDFKYGSIYPFVAEPVGGIVFINILNFDLQGLSFSLEDPNPIPYDDKGNVESNLLTAFQKALTGGSGDIQNDLANGNSAFIKYHWDNPEIEGDEVPDFLERGEVPGTSVKESYIQVVDLSQGIGPKRRFMVFGSGFYPDEEVDDDGCSIAATGSSHQSALLNLLLITSVLFSVVFLRKRV